jgi:hypothetical protein
MYSGFELDCWVVIVQYFKELPKFFFTVGPNNENVIQKSEEDVRFQWAFGKGTHFPQC